MGSRGREGAAARHRLTQANAAGTTTDSYDPLGQLSSEQQSDGTGTLQSTVTYTYDAEGNKLSQTTTPANGNPATTTWTYDKLNRPATLSDGTRSYTYDAAGNVTDMQVFNSDTQTVQSQYAHDGANRLTSLKDYVGPGSTNPLHSYSYAYDAAGNRNSITEDGTTTSYTYDGENQLLTVASGGVTQASYTYDNNHNRTKLVTPAGTTTYTYDSSATDTLLQQKTDPNGKITKYVYDPNGNLTTATYDPTGANQVTTYHYDKSNRLTEIDEPNGTTVTFAYDANGQRIKKTVQTGGANPTMTVVNDVYQSGHLAYQTNLGGTVLATFTYDPNGVPESVVVGSDPVNGPRYYYVYNGHGDVVALTDASGNVVASYSYDVWGNITSSSETIPNANGWTNPYRYDGRDGARYDTETGLYWLSTRAYDPTLGRFLQRDPLGRFPLFFWSQPYVYAGNNPPINVDPSGQRFADEDILSQETAQQQIAQTKRTQQVARMMPRRSAPPKSGRGSGCGGCNARTSQNSSAPCGRNSPCEVGKHQEGGLFGLEGYNTSILQGVGADGIQHLIDVLNSIKGDVLTLLGLAAAGTAVVGGIAGFFSAGVGWLAAGVGIGAIFVVGWQTVSNINDQVAYLTYVKGMILDDDQLPKPYHGLDNLVVQISEDQLPLGNSPPVPPFTWGHITTVVQWNGPVVVSAPPS